ncbi:MAG: penicillin-binding protein 2 [Patescibacteria group bacterium]
MKYTPSHDDPFWMSQSGLGRHRVSIDQTEIVKHEVMFEDEMTRVRDGRMFVGSGIPLRRMKVAFVLFLVGISALIGRSAYMQIVRANEYRSLADDNRFRIQVLPAKRGIIRDREGRILADNVSSFDVRMRFIDLPHDAGQRDAMIDKVSNTIGIQSSDIRSALSSTSTQPDDWVDVAKDISYEHAVALSVLMPQLQGTDLIYDAKRHYPFGSDISSLSHVLGYVGPISPDQYETKKSNGYLRNDSIGKSGVEASYESALRGQAGESKTEVDAVGRPSALVVKTKPIDGSDVTLTIDLDIQHIAETALNEWIQKAHTSRGSAIVMDAQTGALLAAVSLPSFDDNIFAGRVSSTAYKALLADPNNPLFPRAWSGQFPSGSVIKPLIASAALQEGVITPNTTVLSTGGIQVGPWFFPDWKAGGHGSVNVRSALAWSVNTFFYYVGGGFQNFQGLGVDRLSAWMKKFDLGTTTGIDVPGEADGHVPTQEWKQDVKGERWYIGDTYNLSIGQGDLLVTPMQIARMTATVANGGIMVIPHFMDGPSNANPPKVDVDPANFEVVRAGMRDCVVYGSCRALSTLSIPISGKTGTAQWRSDKPNHAWFTSFAPADHPQIVVTVMIEEGVEGSSVAVPVAKEIYQAWIDKQKSMSK